MWEDVKRVWKIKELRNSILFVFFVFIVFRLAAHITVPGIDASGVGALLQSNQFLGLLNLFSGGTLESFSIVALGVGPYITASIISQLLGMIFPKIEEMQKEERGKQTINRWTRVAVVPLAFLQGYGILNIFAQQGVTGIDLSPLNLFFALLSMAAGTVFLMWLGELISERHIGNGLSLVILGGIIAGFPQFISQTAATYTKSDLFDIVLFAALTVVTIIAVVLINEGQRNIPIQYARGGGGSMSKLPMRINMGGMIPIIFAIAVLIFPPIIAQFLAGARTEAVQSISTFILQLFGNSVFYGIAYFLLVFIFTYFYSSVVFKPEQISENLQKQGAFIPGIRPGEQTRSYLSWVQNRLLLTGATFLGAIAVLPLIVQEVTGTQNLVVGGSSILIMVSVVIDMIKQVESQIAMRRYEMK